MKKLLFPLVFLVVLLNPLYSLLAQNVVSIQHSLDSIKAQKALLLEDLEAFEKLEKEYLHLLGQIEMRSCVGKYYQVIVGTNLYENSSYYGKVCAVKGGDIVKLISNKEGKQLVNFNGKEGYIMQGSLEDVNEAKVSTLPKATENEGRLDLNPSAKGDVVSHAYYSLSYSEPNEQAEWVYYKLSAYMLGGNASRTDNFREDTFVSTHSATLADYKGSGYDRGHLCPAGDMTTDLVAMSESFYMSNMSPQNPSFNRGIWKTLESTVRNWAVNEKEIYVATGPVFENNLGAIGSGVTVPGYYYKVVYDPTDEEKMIALVLPNRKGEKQLPEYVVTVDYVENLTGIDFFAGLPDEVENRLESNASSDLWEFKGFNATSGGTATQCKGNAKSTGNQCRNKTTNENGYCYLHQDQATGGKKKETERLTSSVQCKGATTKGARCKNKTLNANGYCHVHQSQLSSNSAIKSSTKASYSKSSYSGGRTIHTGSRGGKYYINSNGNKTYIKK